MTQSTKELACKWADTFIAELMKPENIDTEELDVKNFFKQFLESETDLENLSEETLNEMGLSPRYAPPVLQIYDAILGFYEVPMTRAAMVVSSLGLGCFQDALMNAILLKRMYEVQDPKPEKLDAKFVNLFLQSGTIRSELYKKMWSEGNKTPERCLINVQPSELKK